jgi:hypothetical protein
MHYFKRIGNSENLKKDRASFVADGIENLKKDRASFVADGIKWRAFLI